MTINKGRTEKSPIQPLIQILELKSSATHRREFFKFPLVFKTPPRMSPETEENPVQPFVPCFLPSGAPAWPPPAEPDPAGLRLVGVARPSLGVPGAPFPPAGRRAS